MSIRLGWIEKAAMLIPGYRGYKKRENLREDDRLVRKYVADILRQAAANLQEALREISNRLGSQLMVITQYPGNPLQLLDDAARRILAEANQVEHAEMGYSPSFSRLKVKEEELRRLLEIDNAMIGYANVILEVSKQILQSARSTGWFDTRLLTTLLDSINEIGKIMAERRRFLHGGEAVRSGEIGKT